MAVLSFHDSVNAPEPEPGFSSGAGFTLAGSVEPGAAMTSLHRLPSPSPDASRSACQV